MTTIASNSAAPPPPPPRHRISEGGVGTRPVSGPATIDATSSSAGVSASGTSAADASTAADSLDPESLTDRIGDLLTQQVGNGTLTQVQADTLKGAFENLGGGPEGVGTDRRPPGPPPGPPPDGSASTSDTSDASAGNTDATSTGDLLASFVKQLQAAQNRSGAYAADGTRAGSQTAGALLLDFTA